MITEKICPTCGTRHRVELPHEWTKPGGKMQLEIVHTSQSTNIDNAKLEGLFPREDDGQAIVSEYVWEDDKKVHQTIKRMPIGAYIAKLQAINSPATPTSTGTAKPKSRADLETEAAEKGIEFSTKLKDAQLQQLIEKHDVEKAK